MRTLQFRGSLRLGALMCLTSMAACWSAPIAQEQPSGPQSIFTAPPPAAQEPVLYGRDGQPVGGQSAAPEATAGEASLQQRPPQREVIGESGGRMHLLELYQHAVEERDSLSLEVSSLHADLRQARQTIVTAEQTGQNLQLEVDALVAENARLLAQTTELAGRLSTAQIRRLQAEKILLELRIAEQRAARLEIEAAVESESGAAAGAPQR